MASRLSDVARYGLISLRFCVDMAVVVVGAVLFGNGAIPAELDALGGRWAWMAVGMAAFVVLDETADAMTSLWRAVRVALLRVGSERVEPVGCQWWIWNDDSDSRHVAVTALASRRTWFVLEPPPAGLTSIDEISRNDNGGEQ